MKEIQKSTTVKYQLPKKERKEIEFNEIRDNLLKLVLLLDKFEYDELTRKDILDSNLEYELKTFSFIAA